MDSHDCVSELAARPLSWAILWSGVELIARGLGCTLVAQPQGDGWVIGWGETQDVVEGYTCTQEEADSEFQAVIATMASDVLSACTVAPNSYQLTGLVCLRARIGLTAFESSEVLDLHNQHQFDGAGRYFFTPDTEHDSMILIRAAVECSIYLTV